MPRNFYLEAQLKEAATAAGALESSLPDWELDVEAYRLTNASEIEAWVQKAKKEYPHRFAVQSDHDAELCRAAFIDKNKTAESKLYIAVGEARYKELKALYANGIPESEKKRLNGSADHAKNPWSTHPDWIDHRGRYSAKAIGRQCQIVKSLGETKAAEFQAAGDDKRDQASGHRIRACEQAARIA
jgi:hypothetical protein